LERCDVAIQGPKADAQFSRHDGAADRLAMPAKKLEQSE
jgi:hypothetical protein